MEMELTPEEINLRLARQEIMLKAFKADADGELYAWLKDEYVDVCSNGDVAINSMLDKYHMEEQEKATEEELRYIFHLYETYVYEYLELDEDPQGGCRPLQPPPC